ncbi:hypothetical protein SCP_0507430 [Sparassis crispa]|uniref:F-box domain-containing protein n=1 Tax=Sparassis crispa TaxID=139825 RepID=A0A401GN80_9APHY|nr:hypothetical protein SCP_0507430 [Sparassis crispa]GBE83687.1 hypothetical protein SCP_0507430 [Sparassis crispa]
MYSQLPNETLTIIFENLQPGVLAEVMRASHRLRAVTERILYANIVVAESLSAASLSPVHTINCCETLVAHPHLADVVRKLAVRWHTDPGPREPYLTSVIPAVSTLNQALCSLIHLESLELAFGLTGAPLSLHDVLTHCTFPALRLFALSGIGRGTLPPKFHAPSPPIAWFLADTPSIQHLRLPDLHERVTLAPADLPFLATFRGSPIAAASVIPGRPVHSLALVGHQFVTEPDLEHIAQSAVRIRWLDLSGMSVTPILLRDISRHLTSMEFLKVRLALRHTLHHSLSGISILAGLTPVLGAFPLLRQLDLSPTSVIEGVGSSNALEESTLCTTWARSCTALRHIIFPSHTEWTLAPEQVWVPHAQVPARYTKA